MATRRTAPKRMSTPGTRPKLALERVSKCPGRFLTAARDGDCVLVGGESKRVGVLVRIDGDATASTIATPGLGPIHDLVVDGDVTWICDGSSSIVRSTRKGIERITVPVERALGVTRDDQGLLWVSGLDQGGTWLAVAISVDGQTFEKIELPSECHCDARPLTSTRHGVLLPVVTEDTRDLLWLGRGASIRAIKLRGDFTVSGGVETAAGTLLVVDSTGQVHRSEDGGTTWRRKEASSERLYAAAVFGGDRVVIVGADGVVAVSDDDGKSFVDLDLPVLASTAAPKKRMGRLARMLEERKRAERRTFTCAAALGAQGFVVAGAHGVFVGSPS